MKRSVILAVTVAILMVAASAWAQSQVTVAPPDGGFAVGDTSYVQPGGLHPERSPLRDGPPRPRPDGVH